MTHVRLCLLLGAVMFTACARPSAEANHPTTSVVSTERTECRGRAGSPAQPCSPEPEQLDTARPAPAAPDIDLLLVQLDSSDIEEAIEAAETLARISSAERASVDLLARRLESPDVEERDLA